MPYTDFLKNNIYTKKKKIKIFYNINILTSLGIIFNIPEGEKPKYKLKEKYKIKT